MNRAEMKGVNMNDVSIVSKHDIGYKLNTCYVTQISEKIMQGNFFLLNQILNRGIFQ